MALQLREIAPESYNTLHYHTSWTWVTWKFLSDPEVGPWTRMRRKTKGHEADVKVIDKVERPVFVAGKGFGLEGEQQGALHLRAAAGLIS